MPWVKIDDAIGESVKSERLFRRNRGGLGGIAFGLHILALAYCSRNLTDGKVDPEWVTNRLKDMGVNLKRHTAITDALVDAGQWVATHDGWRIHDFLEFNPSRQEVLEKRAADAERKRKGGSARNPGGVQAESGSPVPSRPVPTSKATPEASPDSEDIGLHDVAQQTHGENADVGQPNLSVIEGRTA